MFDFLQPMLAFFQGKPSAKRSPKWPALRARWLMAHPTCAACGRRTALEVHHIVPFHVDPSLELDVANVISLCEPLGGGCHLRVGHRGAWVRWDPDVVRDAALLLAGKGL